MEGGIIRRRFDGCERGWQRWKERKRFQKKIGSTKSNMGQGSGTLDESVISAIFGVSHLGGKI